MGLQSTCIKYIVSQVWDMNIKKRYNHGNKPINYDIVLMPKCVSYNHHWYLSQSFVLSNPVPIIWYKYGRLTCNPVIN